MDERVDKNCFPAVGVCKYESHLVVGTIKILIDLMTDYSNIKRYKCRPSMENSDDRKG